MLIYEAPSGSRQALSAYLKSLLAGGQATKATLGPEDYKKGTVFITIDFPEAYEDIKKIDATLQTFYHAQRTPATRQRRCRNLRRQRSFLNLANPVNS